ncbi:unnamed protein product [Discosporangium mesarthrocarpum]
MEKEIKKESAGFAMYKVISKLVGMVTIFLLHGQYKGKVMLMLPFEPRFGFQWITHRSLEGDDLRQGSVFFLLSLCSMGMGSNVAKALGFGEIKGMNSLDILMGDYNSQYEGLQRKID